MLTLRTVSLTFLGLLTGFVAAAQTTASHDAPTATNVLSWVVWWAAGVVLLMAILTAGSVTSAARLRYEEQAAEPAAPAAEAAAPAVAARQAAAAAPAATPVTIATPEEVYA